MRSMGAVLRRGWVLGAAAVLSGWLAADAAAQNAGTAAAPAEAPGVNEPAARFRGPLAYDFSVTNVQWEAATPEYSYVTFDLYWSYSWRAKWTEPAKTSATGKDMEVENWDAAWVFVKFLPEKETPEAQARNHWLHATLDSSPASHIMPAGATNFVKLSDDGARGMGLFIYRAALGHGVNDWKKIKLRWNHPPTPAAAGSGAASPPAAAGTRFDPARAAVQVHAIPMVYVPGGAFKVGTGCPSGIYEKFADGPDFPTVNTMHNARSKDQEFGGLTDGSWRGGNSIPFLLDAEWNAPAKEGTRARRLGLAAGELWGTHTFWEVNLSWLGVAGPLPNEYPTGYEPFYCMKYELTQGQYCDFLNSLPPDVAAERAYVGSEVGSDAGMHTETATVIPGPGREPMQVQENGGCTIYSSADAPAKVEVAAEHAEGVVSEDEKKKNREIDGLIGDAFDDKKSKDAKKKKKTALGAMGERPVYGARLPFRRARGTSYSDAYAYAVWAGLRPMSQLEANKAGNGVRDPLAPPDWTGRPNLDAKMEIADLGRPTERFSKGNTAYGRDIGLRVGCFLSPESDRGTALATYWGISEFSGHIVALGTPAFRGTHGNGETAPGKPGAPVKRTVGKFTAAPADWPAIWEYYGGHFVSGSTRLVISAENRIVKPAAAPETDAAKVKKPVLPIPPLDGRQDDFPRVTNVRLDAGKQSSTISFDLAWNNAWRAKWTEPAGKNCTGKPLTLESWDAAWVFVKFRPKGALAFSHVTLSPDAADHGKPAGAALEPGLSNDGKQGIGVFLYRAAVGQGANEFKGVKLRWQHVEDQADPATVELSVHAIPMVYVPDGAFRSKSPSIYAPGGAWTPQAYECQLMTIDTPDASQPSGHVNFSTNYVRVTADWPNGYSAFYCMKYAINQGEYARFLTEAAPDPALAVYNNGEYSYGPHNAARRYGGFYGICGYTIRYSAGELRYEADVPERPAKFLSDADIHSFTAWAGLRPLTKLEYEKACRGPRAVAKEEEAWAPGACAPAAGLAQFVPSLARQESPATGRLAWPGPSYWGIRDMSQSGAIIEWPAVVIEDGREFTPNHGTGTPNPPGGWVFTSRGEWMQYMWQGFACSQIGIWVLPEDCTSLPGDIGCYSSTRTGRYGARAVRTAAARSNADAPLQVAPLPELTGFDLAIVNLAGQYKNEGEQPVKVTLDVALPAESFPFGVTSRTFTAAAKAVTPFKVPLVLTRAVAKVARRGGGGLRLPVQLRRANGEVVAESYCQFSREALSRGQPSLLSLDGGRIQLRLTNATEQQLALSFELPSSADVRMDEPRRSVPLAAGGDGEVVFPVPRQNFPREGACVMPYRLTIGSTALPCETAAEVANIGRWWTISRAKGGPKMAGGGRGGGGDLEEMDGAGEVAGLEGLFSANAAEAFALAAPGKGWKVVTNKIGQVDFAPAGALPTRESIAVAVTRAFAAADADVAVEVKPPAIPKEATSDPFFVRVYVNEKPVFDSSLQPRDRNKPGRLRKGMNTVVAEWHSCEFAESKGGVVALQFHDAKGGKPLPELFLDMNRK